jgi:lipid A 3-O-deacylase
MSDSLRLMVCLIALIASGASCPARAQAQQKSDDKGIFSLDVENDSLGLLGTDKGYTSGVRASWVTAPQNTPKGAVNLARQVPLFANWGLVRSEYAIEQVIFTPGDTTVLVPNPLDRPYNAWLNASFGLIGETGPILDNISLGVGVVGPAALGRETQAFVHKIYGIPSPNGWASLVNNEPTLQLRYQRSWRAIVAHNFNSDYGVDLTPDLGAAVGNVYTLANAGMTLRVGKHLQHDSGPPRIGPVAPGSGFFESHTALGWYLFAGVEGRAVARNIFLDGNTFVDSQHVSKEPFVADLRAGLVITVDQIRFSYTHVWRSREYYGQLKGDQFGAISASMWW